ncbi:transposase [Sinorhizobium medicae]|uniref:transposase n=1 Tax=Sinorhizobium medicae TaxID=110321 RepID=UPI0027DE61AB|nr:transposase [Sinorhizobium medicae]
MRAFEDFEAGDWGATIFGDHPVLARQLGPRCAFLRPPENLRRIIYTTNAIEALNPKLRRAVRTRGHFPRDDAAMKLLYLVLTTIGGVLFAVLKGAIFIITNMFN